MPGSGRGVDTGKWELTMASRQWPIIEVPLKDLALDAQNVRIAVGHLDEPGIAAYLCEADDLLGLTRDLLRDGYIDNEVPLVVSEDGKYTVLEANRRVAALKAMRDPDILGRFAPLLERLMTRFPDADRPSEIRVMVAPSRAAAQPVLARLHTGRPKKSWIREQQAVFFHAQISDTVSVDDLRIAYPRESGKIVGFIRMGEMRELIRSVRYVDSELEQFVMSSQLKMSSLEYAYDRPRIRELLGLEFNDEGFLRTKKLSAGQLRGLMYLLRRFRDGTLNTRSDELKERHPVHLLFVETLGRVVSGGHAAPSSTGSSRLSAEDSDTGGPGGGSDSVELGRGAPGGSASEQGAGGDTTSASDGLSSGDGGASGAGSRGANRGDTRSRLDFTGFEYKGNSAGLRRRLEEIKRLDLREFPNAAHDLVRTVLECAIKDYFVRKGSPLGDKMLKGCVEELGKEFQGDQRITALINSINRKGKMTANQYAGTAYSLNAANHDPDTFVVAADVHEAWERIKPILVTIVG